MQEGFAFDDGSGHGEGFKAQVAAKGILTDALDAFLQHNLIEGAAIKRTLLDHFYTAGNHQLVPDHQTQGAFAHLCQSCRKSRLLNGCRRDCIAAQTDKIPGQLGQSSAGWIGVKYIAEGLRANAPHRFRQGNGEFLRLEAARTDASDRAAAQGVRHRELARSGAFQQDGLAIIQCVFILTLTNGGQGQRITGIVFKIDWPIEFMLSQRSTLSTADVTKVFKCGGGTSGIAVINIKALNV